MGVLGEIFTGLFAQAYLSPQVLVRVIRHWPDLIFYVGNEIYAFVESKAFTERLDGRRLQERVPGTLLRELLCDAVAQLNADPHLEVWGGFTGVLTIQPQFAVAVTMLRLTPPDERRQQNPRKRLPPAVVRGVAERALAQAVAHVGPELLLVLNNPKGSLAIGPTAICGPPKKVSRVEVEAMLIENAMREAEEVLAASGTSVAVAGSREEITHAVESLVRECKPSALHTGKRFFEIKARNGVATLQRVRRAGDEWIFMANLPPVDVHQLREAWQSSWEAAAGPVSAIEGYPVWRCGGAAYCLGPEALDQRTVRLRQG